MDDIVVIGGELSLLNVIDGNSSLLNVVDGQAGQYIPIESDPHPYYEGDYIITPMTTAQILHTADTLLTEDITVVEIPYFETSNLDGTTVYIANSI